MTMRTARMTTWVLGLLIAALPLTAGAASVMVPYSEFKTWPKEKQVKYFQDLRKIAADFEMAVNVDTEFAALEPRFELPAFLPEAFADSGRYCLIGGVRRVMKPNAEGRMVCPTQGRGCGNGDSFKCGSIYNDACVARTPLDEITRRCSAAAGNAIPDQAFYNERRANMERIAQSCRNGEIAARFSSQCNRFTQRLNTIAAAYGGSAVPSGTPAWQDAEKGEGGVPPIENFGGTPDAPPPPAEDEKGEKGSGIDVAPAPPVEPPPEVVTPPPTYQPPPSTSCIERNRTKLGELACIACGLEEWNPADVLTNGGGATKWVALLGIMAQTYHGPYNPGDRASRDQYLGRVAEMVATYGYCTDNEYPMSMPNDARDWIGGRSSLRQAGQDQSEFANGFGLMSDKRGGLFTSRVEYSSRPMTLAKQIFDVGRSWSRNSPHENQWRFRSMIRAHYNSYPSTAFSNCARAAENRMRNLQSLKMCTIREGQWPNGAMRIIRPDQMAPEEFGNNERFYAKLIRTCNVNAPRVVPRHCDHSCYRSEAHRHATSVLPYCENVGGGNNNNDNGGSDGRNDGPGSHNNDGGKNGEPESGRGDGNDGGGNNGNGNNGGNDGGNDGGKGGEGESAR